jgi:hypothetical protein
MDLKVINDYKFPAILAGVIVLLVVLWITGVLGTGMATWERMLSVKERKISDELKAKLKVVKQQVAAVENKVKVKDGEIVQLRKEQDKLKEELDGLKKKKEVVTIPTDTSGMANEFKQFGFKSVTVIRR